MRSLSDARKRPARKSPSRKRPARKSRSPQRLALVFTVLLLAFGALGARLVMLQIVDAPAYAQIASDQRKRTVLFPARRGTIFDRDGNELAISVDMQTIWADPQLVEDPVAEAAKLAPLLDMKVDEVTTMLSGTAPGSRFEYIMRQAEPSVANEVEKLKLAGVYMQPEAKRYYPNDRLASHVIGFSDVDGKGVAGIELEYEDILQGKPGEMVLEQDPSGNPLPQAEFSYDGPEAGRSLFLTIDKELQFFTETTLAAATEQYNAKAATAIIMRPQTGEILALANVPDYDPNRTGDFDEGEQRNRALTDQFEPGSIFKLITGSAALQEKIVTPKTTYDVPDELAYIDRVFHDSHSHAAEVMTVSDIITESSNVGTIKIGLDLGADALDKYVYKFGFGALTGLDFPGEIKGEVLPREEWSGTTIATIPIGQGIAVTALQMAAAYSTIANDGVWTEPKLLSASMNSEGKVLESPAPATKRVVSRSTAHKVTRILERVVKEGTGTAAAVPGYDVAGKTGTAQKVDDATGTYGHEYVASFAGYAPADNPEIAIIVSFDEPELIYGGDTAAPTFSTITEFALRHLGVTPSEDAAKAAEKAAQADAENAPAYD